MTIDDSTLLALAVVNWRRSHPPTAHQLALLRSAVGAYIELPDQLASSMKRARRRLAWLYVPLVIGIVTTIATGLNYLFHFADEWTVALINSPNLFVGIPIMTWHGFVGYVRTRRECSQLQKPVDVLVRRCRREGFALETFKIDDRIVTPPGVRARHLLSKVCRADIMAAYFDEPLDQMQREWIEAEADGREDGGISLRGHAIVLVTALRLIVNWRRW